MSADGRKTKQLTSKKGEKHVSCCLAGTKRFKTSYTLHSGCFLGSLRPLVLLEQLIRGDRDGCIFGLLFTDTDTVV